MNYSKLTLKFSMDNAAFEDDPHSEASRILRHIANRIDNGDDSGTVKDVNGNTIGEWSLWT